VGEVVAYYWGIRLRVQEETILSQPIILWQMFRTRVAVTAASLFFTFVRRKHVSMARRATAALDISATALDLWRSAGKCVGNATPNAHRRYRCYQMFIDVNRRHCSARFDVLSKNNSISSVKKKRIKVLSFKEYYGVIILDLEVQEPAGPTICTVKDADNRQSCFILFLIVRRRETNSYVCTWALEGWFHCLSISLSL